METITLIDSKESFQFELHYSSAPKAGSLLAYLTQFFFFFKLVENRSAVGSP